MCWPRGIICKIKKRHIHNLVELVSDILGMDIEFFVRIAEACEVVADVG